MTWLFGKEKEAMSRGDIALFLYQNRQSPRLGGNFHRPENPHIILQLTDTTKNWPRIGFEAMANGSVLIVDKRGGWEQMIIHPDFANGIEESTYKTLINTHFLF
ncbi:MAG: hypothetical protein RR373_04635 [Akkermansia sp.]